MRHRKYNKVFHFNNNLTLSSVNDTTIKASNIKTDGDITINTGNNLIIATASENHLHSIETNNKGNYFFKNGQYGSYNTKIINTEITSNASSDNVNSNLTFNIGNIAVVEYNKASKTSDDNASNIINIANVTTANTNTNNNTNTTYTTNTNTTKTGLNNSILYGDFSQNSKLAYLNKLDSSITLYNPVEEINKSWNQTTRGLTGAGQAVVAITTTALTMGTMSGVGAAAGSAAGGGASGAATAAGASATAAASIGTVAASATNAATIAALSSVASQASISAINNQGRLNKVAKDITSKEALKNTAIAAVGAGIAAGATKLIYPTNISTANANWAQRVGTNLETSFTEVATQTVASTAAQSAINGDSFTEALKNQGKNVLIYTVAKVAANEIGAAYHPTDGSAGIGKPLQLTLHAGLGAAIAAATKNDVVSGAIAGVVGEQVAETANKHGGFNQQTSIQLANLAGGISSVTYGGLTNQSDDEMAKNAWEGSRISGNAARENALFYRAGTNSNPKDVDKEFIKAMEDSTGEKVVVLSNILKNTDESRIARGKELATTIRNYQLENPNEPIILVGHSHGGNVIKDATNFDLGGKKINTVVFLGTPHRVEYQLNQDTLSVGATVLNVYDKGDWVQRFGFIDSAISYPFGNNGHLANQQLIGATNIEIFQTEKMNNWDWKTGIITTTTPSIGWLDSHTNLDSKEIWNTHVIPNLPSINPVNRQGP
jgi:hypothetical protein